MKKVFFLIIFLLFPFCVNAFVIDGFYKTINVSLDCDECKDKDTREIKVQLFANGEGIPDTEQILDIDNDFAISYEDYPIFEDDGFTEIEYEVRFFEDGMYRPFNKSEISYEKETISKWVSVMPEDLKPGHQYVFLTDNWYYEYNDRDPFILLDGKMYHQYVDIYADYNIIDGKKSYYSLGSEPNEKTIWEIAPIPEDTHHYDLYKDYVILKNVHYDKNLSLIGTMGDGANVYSWRVSSRDGWQEDELSKYTSKVKLTPIDNELGRFQISSETWWSEDHISKRYLGIGHSVEVKAQVEEAYAAHFVAFEYVEDIEVEKVFNVHIDKEICKNLNDIRKVLLSDIVDVLGVFEEIGDVTGIDFTVVDPSIAKVEDGKVIPLKIGETDVNFKYGYTDYTLHLVVYDVPGNNPKTSVGSIMILLTLIMVVCVLINSIGKKKINY